MSKPLFLSTSYHHSNYHYFVLQICSLQKVLPWELAGSISWQSIHSSPLSRCKAAYLARSNNENSQCHWPSSLSPLQTSSTLLLAHNSGYYSSKNIEISILYHPYLQNSITNLWNCFHFAKGSVFLHAALV